MAENRKILLYRIDEQTKNVIFVVTEDDEKVWGNITEDMQTVLSFDEIFRDITEFRDGFLDYEQFTDELISAINGRVLCSVRYWNSLMITALTASTFSHGTTPIH